MKRLFALFMLLFVFSAPAFAQTPTAASVPSPANFLPFDTARYMELRVDDAGLNALNTLGSLGFGILNTPTGGNDNVLDMAYNGAYSSLFGGANVRTDILPWLSDRVGIGIVGAGSDAIFVLPVLDSNAETAFIGKFMTNTASHAVGGIRIYTDATVAAAVGSGVLWVSTTAGIDQLLATPMLERLSDNPGYQKLRADLPADAPLSAYVSSTYIASALSDMQASQSPSMPSFSAIVEAALRLHPAQSAAEDALLKSPALNGIGLAVQVSSGKIDATAILSIEAQYPAPTLTTKTAGTALLSLIPGDSFVVFDSYDLSATALPVAALTYLAPTVGSTFGSISVNLDTGEILPTPTSTPSPTPAPPLTADALMAQVQPILAQAQSTMGLSLNQLYSLIDGEYAIAVFPGVGPTLGEALYLQSSDPQKIIDTLDHVSKLILTDPTNDTQLVTLEHRTVDGVGVVLLDGVGAGDRPALGILNKNVLFLTMESTVSKVIESAKNQSPATPALKWRDKFGDAQEAFLYLDPQTVDLYNLRTVRNPPLPISALAGSFDVRDNGRFVLHLTATIGS